MGTYYTVQLWSDEDFRIQEIDTEIAGLLDQFEYELSNWREGSWINHFNAAQRGVAIAVPGYAFQVVSLCLELAERSDGLLDPTAGPLIELWGFGTERSQRVPSKELMDQTLSRIGYDKLKLDPQNRTLTKTVDGVQLNCSAVAKGYAVDMVAECLTARGITDFLVNIGGEVRAKGTRLDGRPWKVGVRQPVFQGRDGKIVRSVELSNRALATSGHSQRSFEIDGRRHSHILNPKTGRPVPVNIAGATVLAPTCALADGLATLALITGEAEMQALTDQFEDVKIYRTSWATDDLAKIH